MCRPTLSYHASRAGDTGAEPQPRTRAWSNPRPSASFFLMRLFTNGILSKKFSFFCGSLSWIRCWNRVHKRGTEINKVGRCIFTSSINVSKDSGKAVTPHPLLKNQRCTLVLLYGQAAGKKTDGRRVGSQCDRLISELTM